MEIGYLQKFSLIDYPGSICATLFTRGCNFRCPYCHNPELVIGPPSDASPTTDDVLDFLEKRRGKLQAVTITGGEPTIHGDRLLRFAAAVKEKELLVKVDTNGTMPDVLKNLIDEHLVDYIAMDVKGPLDAYSRLTCVNVDIESIRRSIELIMTSAPDYEFRTTVARSLLSHDDLEETARTIAGAKRYILQKFVPSKTLDPAFMNEGTYDDEAFEVIMEKIRRWVPDTDLR
ncbi:MAG: hypothetical protein AVO39_01715 [delta proteobacterium MLS_D]|nr:MAG: hypothetical protein AVO39_01715 [delta proteobacterium MLS_D]